ncbi:hypothetical protein [Litorisediminicola beolgyonensis]|uniref:Uncharacterized protein n=1 Tax=Litorisediminicola beolgyonensis TaxID=1173614 RepID=A0ABW3ZJN0_9RHOB
MGEGDVARSDAGSAEEMNEPAQRRVQAVVLEVERRPPEELPIGGKIRDPTRALLHDAEGDHGGPDIADGIRPCLRHDAEFCVRHLCEPRAQPSAVTGNIARWKTVSLGDTLQAGDEVSLAGLAERPVAFRFLDQVGEADRVRGNEGAIDGNGAVEGHRERVL